MVRSEDRAMAIHQNEQLEMIMETAWTANNSKVDSKAMVVQRKMMR